MFSSLEAEQQKQQARANAGAYSPSYAAAGRPRPVEVVHGGPCNGFSPSPYRPQNRVQNDPASPSEGTGVGSVSNSFPRSVTSQPNANRAGQQAYFRPEITSYDNHNPSTGSFSVQPTNHTEYFSPSSPSQWSPPPPPPPNALPQSPLLIPASPALPAAPAPPPPPPPQPSTGAPWRAGSPPRNEQVGT